MECKKCGAQLEKNQSVCPVCGTKNKQKEKWTTKKTVKLILTCTSILLVLTLAAGIMTMFAHVGSFKLPWRDNVVACRDQYTETDFWSEWAEDRVVATMGKYELTNRQLRVFFWMQFYEILDYYGNYAEYYLGVDVDKPLYEQQHSSGQTWEQYIMEEALMSWHRYQAAAAVAEQNGFKMPQEYQEDFAKMKDSLATTAKEQGFLSADDMIQNQFGSGVTFEDYHNYLWIRYTAELYFSEVINNMKFTDAELDAFYQENKDDLAEYGVYQDDSTLVDFRNIRINAITSKDEKGNTVITEDAWATCLEKAQDIYDTLVSGDNSEETFAALAKLKSQDTNSSANGGLYQYAAKNQWTTVDIRHILIMPDGGTKDASGNVTYSEEEWEACRLEAQLLLDEYLAGEKTEEAFGALANKHSEDQNGKVTNGGLYADVYSGQMVKAFDAWIFDDSRVPGETGLVKTEYGYHVMYFVSRNGPVDDWAFSADRQVGDIGLVKTESGYEILYYIGDAIAWEVWCEEGLLTQTSQDLVKSYAEMNPIEVNYWGIILSERVTDNR